MDIMSRNVAGTRTNIDWEMLDKKKFLPLCFLSSFFLKTCVYPLQVIKLRLQMQHRNQAYNGFCDAMVKMYRQEGAAAFYKGFWVNSVQTTSGIVYVTANESSRQVLSFYEVPVFTRALVGGGTASLAAQTVVVPLDVISQHLAVAGLLKCAGKNIPSNSGLNLPSDSSRGSTNTTTGVIQSIYKSEGLMGFYRGFLVSVACHVPHSALWWTLYQVFKEKLSDHLPKDFPNSFVQFASGALSGLGTGFLTNPIDVVKARFQIIRTKSLKTTCSDLWQEEGMCVFTKGLSARLMHSIFISSSIITGYEAIKRLSVKEEFKNEVQW